MQLRYINSASKVITWLKNYNNVTRGVYMNTADGKQERKRNRTKTFFIDAAKEMIIGEGVESVSVRKVAELAGYSYPTLYSYFADLNALLWEVRQDMVKDLVLTMSQHTAMTATGTVELKHIFKAYIGYYLENPNIYEFFYLYPLAKPAQKAEDSDSAPDFQAIWSETFKEFVMSGKLRAEEIGTVAKILIYAIHGMLNLSFTNNGDLNERENLNRDLDRIVDYLIDRS
jgi:AcrR family transcriptional regulator